MLSVFRLVRELALLAASCAVSVGNLAPWCSPPEVALRFRFLGIVSRLQLVALLYNRRGRNFGVEKSDFPSLGKQNPESSPSHFVDRHFKLAVPTLIQYYWALIFLQVVYRTVILFHKKNWKFQEKIVVTQFFHFRI